MAGSVVPPLKQQRWTSQAAAGFLFVSIGARPCNLRREQQPPRKGSFPAKALEQAVADFAQKCTFAQLLERRAREEASRPLVFQLTHPALRRALSTAGRMGLGAEAEALVADLVERTPGVFATVQAELPSGFPESLATAILEGLQRSAERLQSRLS
jgi:hypothetical protein